MYCVQTWSLSLDKSCQNVSCIYFVLEVCTVSVNRSTPHSHKRGMNYYDSYICPISDVAVIKGMVTEK